MARPLRIERAGAIYQVMTRGNARQAIFGDDTDRRRRLSWVARDVLLEAWEGGWVAQIQQRPTGGYLEQGFVRPPENPFSGAAHGWLLGGEGFVKRICRQMNWPRYADEAPRAQLLGSVEVDSVSAAVIGHYRIDTERWPRISGCRKGLTESSHES